MAEEVARRLQSTRRFFSDQGGPAACEERRTDSFVARLEQPRASVDEGAFSFGVDEAQAHAATQPSWCEQVLSIASRLQKAEAGQEEDLRAAVRVAVVELRQLAAPAAAARGPSTPRRPAAVAAVGSTAVVGPLWGAVTTHGSSDDSTSLQPPEAASSGRSWTCVSTLKPHVGGVWGLAHVARGMVASGDDGGFLRLWDVRSKRQVAEVPSGGGWLNCLDLLDENALISGSQDGAIRIWDTENHRMVTSLTVCDTEILSILAVGPDLAICGSKSGEVCLWDPRAEGCRMKLKTGEQSTGCAIYGIANLSSGRVVSGSGDGLLRLWDVRAPQRQEPIVLNGGGGPIWSMTSVGKQSDTFFSGYESGEMKVWDASGDAPRTTATVTDGTRGGCLLCLAVLDDDCRVASGHIGDSILRVWEPTNNRCVAELRGHRGAVRNLTLLPGGGLGSGSQDGTVRIWEPGAPR